MAVLVFATGVFMVHHANHHDGERPCRLLKVGGYIVIVASILGALCTGFYWLKYYGDGVYDRPNFHHTSKNTSMNMDGQMHRCMGMMSGKTMGPSEMQNMKSCMQNGNTNN